MGSLERDWVRSEGIWVGLHKQWKEAIEKDCSVRWEWK